MKLALLAAILTTFISLSASDDPALSTARRARDSGDVKTLQTEITNAEKKAEQTKLFDDSFDSRSCTTGCVKQPRRATIAEW